jgi:hypothetical protein
MAAIRQMKTARHVQTVCTVSAGLHNISNPYRLQQHYWFKRLKNVELDPILRYWYRVAVGGVVVDVSSILPPSRT